MRRVAMLITILFAVAPLACDSTGGLLTADQDGGSVAGSGGSGGAVPDGGKPAPDDSGDGVAVEAGAADAPSVPDAF